MDSRIRKIKEKYGEDFFVVSGAKGGKAKVRKGTAYLKKDERKQHAKMMAKARWDKVRREKVKADLYKETLAHNDN